VLDWGKDENKIQEKLNQWSLIIKEYTMRMKMDKNMTGFQGTYTHI
jgi:hypothetical protein